MASAFAGLGGVLPFIARFLLIVCFFCENSTQGAPSSVLQVGEIINGTTADAIQDPQFTGSKLGVWYLVVGTGGFLAGSICTGNIRSPDSKIVASGNCEYLWAVTLPKPFGNGENKGMSIPVWFSASNKPYYVSMYYSHYPEAFAFTIFETAAAPNEDCSTAIALELDEIVEGEIFEHGDGDVWYSFAGTGGLLSVATCTGDSTLDNNDCNIHFRSVDHDGGTCGNGKSTVYFESAANETYFFQVREVNGVLGHLTSES